jgi:hypothetical protein
VRRLNKSVLAGGVVYPAGAEGDDVEKAVTNPKHWDDFDETASAGVVDEAKVLELVTFAKTTTERLESLLLAVAPLVVADPEDTSAETLLDLVFNTTDEGLGLLTENVQKVVAVVKARAAEAAPASPAPSASETPSAPTPEPVDYSSKSKPELEGEVKRRNESRDKPLEVKAPGNKPDLIAALVADDDKKN